MRAILPLLLLTACPAKPSVDGKDGDDTATPTITETDGIGLEARPANETCAAVDRPATGADVTFTEVFAGLDLNLPLAMIQPPGVSDFFWVVEQGGTIQRFANNDGVTESTIALDIEVSAWSGNEDGLLGAAFHPDFASNGWLFIMYTTGSSRSMTNRVSRLTSTDGGLTFDVDTEEILLDIDDPYTNHNGGHVAFGPDGLLYIGTGDGGSGGDPEENGQNTDALLAKMLRIDVDSLPYQIPSDNPFAGGGGEPEIFAWGLRNPWRFSFDRESGVLWAGDVGQDAWEEVDIIEAGGNYGWNEKEGDHCYDGRNCEGPYIDPIAEYSHDDGDSITGGFVYRGSAIPGLVGTYLYADAYQGKVWALYFDDQGVASPELVYTLAGQIPSSFAEDSEGELYVLDFGSNRDDGQIFKLEPLGDVEPSDFPETLSATGCVDVTDPTLPATGMIPYGVNMELWSDGAEKDRWFAIPDGTTISIRDDGTFEFPVGSVTMKQFGFGGKPVETRLMMLHDDGEWAGYTYEWNETGTDADLLPADKSVSVDGNDWYFPSRSQCLQCHTSVADRVLGLRVQQLDGGYTYPNGATENQMGALARIGMFAGTPPSLAVYPKIDGSASGEDRARAYLAANCSFCHQPDGTGGGPMDVRFETAFADTLTCGEAPVNGDLGVTGAQVVAAGDPSMSVLSLRMHALDVHRMPPVASHAVDDIGTALIDDWITGATCP